MRWGVIIAFIVGFITGLFASVPTSAQGRPTWNKAQVVPMVIVRYGKMGFYTETGGVWGPIWTKDEVTPMCNVKFDREKNLFFSADEGPFGATWSRKEEVKPYVTVIPDPYSSGTFILTPPK